MEKKKRTREVKEDKYLEKRVSGGKIKRKERRSKSEE